MARQATRLRSTRRAASAGSRHAAPARGLFERLVAREAPATETIGVIRQGIPARVVDDMAAWLDVPKHAVFALLGMPETTAHRLLRDDRALDAAGSERVVRVAGVARTAEAVLGDRERARRWLRTGNLGLGDATPLSMLDTELGAAEVRRVLAAIAHGGVV